MGRPFVDLTTNIYGYLAVLARIGSKHSSPLWSCECSCGHLYCKGNVEVTSRNLNNSSTTSCGAGAFDHKYLDRAGDTYGQLTVIDYAGKTKFGHILWYCNCSCGGTCVVEGDRLVAKTTTHCGCSYIRQPEHDRRTAVMKKEYAIKKYRHTHKFTGDMITFEQFKGLSIQKCHYCGIDHSRTLKDRNIGSKHTVLINGIDRINNSKGYIDGNCVPCCSTCNYAKQGMSYDEFMTWINRVYFYYILSKEAL